MQRATGALAMGSPTRRARLTLPEGANVMNSSAVPVARSNNSHCSALRTAELKPHHFRRQVPLGPYYADFASHGARLVIEVDGSGHFTDAASTYDARRDAFLRAEGYRVLRVTTLDVLRNPDGVYAAVLAAVSHLDS